MRKYEICFFEHLVATLFCFTTVFLNAQSLPFVCGTDECTEQMLIDDPQLQAEADAFELFYQNWITTHTPDVTTDYIIPVVVHVMETNGQAFLDDWKIEQVICNTNLFLHGLDLSGEEAGLDTHIQLRLANLDESGFTTTGIEHLQSDVECLHFSGGQAPPTCPSTVAELELNDWNTNSYFNIYVVNDIEGAISAFATIGGGYVFISRIFIYNGDFLSDSENKLLVHEVGHALNLYHTFQGGCYVPDDCLSQGDNVCDTPMSANTGSVVCGPVLTGCSVDDVPLIEDVPYLNFMSYSPCTETFTQGQLDRMDANLATKESWWNESNLIATGVAGELNTPGLFSATSTQMNDATCPTNLCDGSAQIVVTGESNFTLDFDSTTMEGGPVFNVADLCAGNYNYIIRDEYGCHRNFSISIVLNVNSVLAYLDNDLDGFGTGDLISTCEPLVAFSYIDGDCNDNNFSENPAMPEHPDGLDQDCDGWIDEGLFLLNAQINSYLTNNCFDIGGIAFLGSITGGTPPYSIAINPLPNGAYGISGSNDFAFYVEEASNIVYTIVVQDAVGLQFSLNSEIQIPVFPTGILVGNAYVCSGSSTTLLAVEDTNGNEVNYDVIWDLDNQFNLTQFDANVGLHTVELTDQLGCSTELSIDVIQFTAASIDHRLCYQDDTELGYIQYQSLYPPIAITSNFPLNWNALAEGLGVYSSTYVGPISVGEFVVTITDEMGCDHTEAFSVINGIPLNIQTNTNPPTCADDSDGNIELIVTGGSGNYTFNWTDVPGESDAFINNLLNGSYDCTISDAEGCTASVTATIQTEPMSIELLSAVPATCMMTCDGSASLSVTGGSGSILIDWNNDGNNDGLALIGLCQGTQYIHASDVNGCTTSNTIEIPYDAFDIEGDLTYAGENWSGQSISLNGDLTFPAGVWNNLSDVNLIFSEGFGIVVEEGAVVDIEHLNITSCGESWKGIDVRSSINSGEYGTFIWRGGLCSFAENAIFISNEQPENLWGPILDISNVDFRNNKQSFFSSACVANSEGGFIGPFAFTNCSFAINDEYANHFDDVIAQARLINTIGYGFKSCLFANNTSSIQWSERGKAIFATNSRFDVDDIDADGNDAQGSYFRGWNFGIDAENTDVFYDGMIIRESTFEQNHVAIYNLGVGFQTLVRNQIEVGDASVIDQLNDDIIDREGIVIDGGLGGFLVSENVITGHALPEGAAVGIRTRDVISGVAEIYNNTVTQCSHPFMANGNNSVNQEGLRYVCNNSSLDGTANANGIDIYVGEFPEIGIADISPWQSALGAWNFLDDLEKAAGNTFTQNPNEANIVNLGPEINYLYFNDGDGPQTPLEIVGTIDPSGVGQLNTCDQVVVDFVPDIDDPNELLLLNLEQVVLSSHVNWMNSKYLYIAIIDDGNTQELMDLIDNTWNSNVWSTRATLLNGSPYLSEEVLLKLGDYTPEMPYLMALEIFLANPNVTHNASFILYLKETTSLPDEMIELIAENINESALREQLEEHLAKNHMRYLNAKSAMLRYKIRESSTTRENLQEELNNLESLASEFAIIDNLLTQKSVALANLLYSDIPERILFTKLEMSKEYDPYADWLNFCSENTSFVNLDNISLSTLYELADNYYYTTAGKHARVVLNSYYEGQYFTPPYYGESSVALRALLEQLNAIKEIHLVEAFPNPADEYLQINFNSGINTHQNEVIAVYDTKGVLIQSYKVTVEKKQWMVNTLGWTSGNYKIVLTVDNVLLETISINVVH